MSFQHLKLGAVASLSFISLEASYKAETRKRFRKGNLVFRRPFIMKNNL